ncbi:DNA translocase FtsK [Virgibacillus phasianinus]|uniref:DNA translocase FtsK n=1 Tax=Virgibacillus phasianinus TaxID=2017483 RepID=A0A220U488_9BACI|nr:DNA translocase FtsK [Virgibacillus phasianinus]ASK62927.1 DNA translocase FtsK [Virgibacillus phasianinus]
MWGQWKEKLLDLFYTEVEIEDEEEEDEPKKQQRPLHNMQHKDKLETKVMYQYPERKEFRFPVIPDKVEQKQPMDTPAYQRRKENDYRHEQRENKPNKNHYQWEKREQREKKDNSKKVPFQPTEVPSPIHGFRQREKVKKVEDVPAFVRKQQEEPQQDITASNLAAEQSAVTQEISPVNKEENENENTRYDNNSWKETNSMEYEKNEQVQEKQLVNEPVNEHSQQERIEQAKEPAELRNKKKELKNKKQNPIANKSKQQGKLPFNVMMSANDKRKQEMLEKMMPVKPTPEREKESSFEIPNYLLNDPVPKNNKDQIWVKEQQELLEKTLKHFNVRAKVVNATQGPAVTRFEVQPEIGVKVSKVKNLSDDLKLNMAARDIRIEAPIPGKNTIGIEIPNQTSQMVGLQEIFETSAFTNSNSPLSVALGLDIEGTPMITNIQKMPHGLIAGATGSGKSVCINTVLISLLYKASHEDVKFLLIDPKMVELAPFNEIPHLVSPVITDVKAATMALKWAVGEMEERYEKFVHEGVRDVERYNQKMKKQGRFDEKMPFLVIVIDELADLMMAAPQDVEDSICRIAQKARACGMHLLVATQRPSVDVITGLIKANIPTRIAFSVSSQVDSRTIIDTNGAEKLLGKGDMLFVENGSGKSVRLQGAFVSDDEIERVTRYIRSIAPPNYLFEQEQLLEQVMIEEEDEDDLLTEAIQFVVKQNGASTSLLQRHFKIGYNRAARLMDTMEMKGIISEQNGSKPREVLLTTQQIDAN